MSVRDWLATVRRAGSAPRTLPAPEAYTLWAANYPPWPHNPLMRAEQAAVAAILRTTSPTRALDIGTGSGRYLPLLVAAGARIVVGIDLSMTMLTWRNRPEALRAGEAVLTAPRMRGDACRLPFRDASWDLVNASLMVGDIQNLGAWMHEIGRVLMPGGHLIYSDFHPSWARHGWRRTFETPDGSSVAIPYFAHAIAEHQTTLNDHRFDVSAIHEVRLTGDHAAEPLDAHTPVVVVFHALKRAPPQPAWRAVDFDGS
jgi:SAM-dependent methyltransferase